MTLKLHNTLSGKLDEFKPRDPSGVKMFVCGPTVYDFAHIGNGKTYTQFDVVARTLRYLGFNLTYVVNITDIDDKIIDRARERNISPEDLAREYEAEYLKDMESLHNTSADKYARASDYISQIVSQVERLIEKGLAYKISDGYYFDIEKFSEYGKLSGRSALKADDSVSRVDENPEKKDPRDFCLWKFKKPVSPGASRGGEGEPSWQASIGEGRPGWHIEDTAITETLLGPQYDIHGGAIDLIFPHHEAEIAQMESISGKSPLVNYWLHAGFLNIVGKKMSKSLGNFYTIRDVVEKGFDPLALRYYYLSAQYKTPMNFTWEGLEGAANALKKLTSSPALLLGKEKGENGEVNQEYKKQFIEKLENDINTPQALAILWTLVKDKDLSPADKRATLLDFDKVLGLGLK